MALRHIIQIDEDLCDGCGECVPSCVEGALKIVNGKARLVSDVLCDGLGACLGECPTGALTVITREAGDFDEAAAGGHGSTRPVVSRVAAKAMPVPMAAVSPAPMPRPAEGSQGGCPGSRVQMFEDDVIGRSMASMPPQRPGSMPGPPSGPRIIPIRDRSAAGPSLQAEPVGTVSASRLRQWPVQLHLVPPTAPFFQGRDVLLAADCVPVAVADFHASLLDGRGLAIACPKLDQHQDVYVQKLAAMIDDGHIRSLTVAIMEVPCCSGLVHLVQQARAAASRDVPLRLIKVGIRGTILADVPA